MHLTLPWSRRRIQVSLLAFSLSLAISFPLPFHDLVHLLLTTLTFVPPILSTQKMLFERPSSLTRLSEMKSCCCVYMRALRLARSSMFTYTNMQVVRCQNQ